MNNFRPIIASVLFAAMATILAAQGQPAPASNAAQGQPPPAPTADQGRGGRGGRGQQGPPPVLGKMVFDGKELAKGLQVRGNNPRAINVFFDGITTRGQRFEMHLSNLGPGLSSPGQPHQHEQEELMILLDGTAGFEVDGETTTVGPGSVCFVPSNVPHRIRNMGTTDIRYLHLTIIGQ